MLKSDAMKGVAEPPGGSDLLPKDLRLAAFSGTKSPEYAGTQLLLQVDFEDGKETCRPLLPNVEAFSAIRSYSITSADERTMLLAKAGCSSHCASSRRQKVISITLKRLECLEEKLLGSVFLKLKWLSPELRRRILEQRFSQIQRLALERWLVARSLQEHSKGPFGSCASSENIQHSHIFAPVSVPQCKGGSPSGNARSESLRKIGSKKSRHNRRKPRALPSKTMEPRVGRTKPGVQVYVSSSGTKYFYAVASCGMLRFTCRKCRDFEVAVHHRKVLLAICHQISAATSGSIDDATREALLAVPTVHGASTAELGIRFSVSFWAYRWVGLPLTTPTFSVGTTIGLEHGLSALRRLQQARSTLRASMRTEPKENRKLDHSSIRGSPPTPQEVAAWCNLREVLVDIEAETKGIDRAQCLERIGRLELARASYRERCAETWIRRQLALEKDSQRKACQLSERRSKQLEAAQMKIHAAQQRELKRRRVIEDRSLHSILHLLVRLQRVEDKITKTIRCLVATRIDGRKQVRGSVGGRATVECKSCLHTMVNPLATRVVCRMGDSRGGDVSCRSEPWKSERGESAAFVKARAARCKGTTQVACALLASAAVDRTPTFHITSMVPQCPASKRPGVPTLEVSVTRQKRARAL